MKTAQEIRDMALGSESFAQRKKMALDHFKTIFVPATEEMFLQRLLKYRFTTSEWPYSQAQTEEYGIPYFLRGYGFECIWEYGNLCIIVP